MSARDRKEPDILHHTAQTCTYRSARTNGNMLIHAEQRCLEMGPAAFAAAKSLFGDACHASLASTMCSPKTHRCTPHCGTVHMMHCCMCAAETSHIIVRRYNPHMQEGQAPRATTVVTNHRLRHEMLRAKNHKLCAHSTCKCAW